MKLGGARSQANAAWRLVVVEVAEDDASFSYRLDRHKLRKVRRREGRYLLRTNLTEQDPAKLWSYYLQLVAVEEAFKNLKGDLALRPIHHQRITRCAQPERGACRGAHLHCQPVEPRDTARFDG